MEDQMSNIGEKAIVRIIRDVLAEIGRQDCNMPIVTPGPPDSEGLVGEGVRFIPVWGVVFSCPVEGERHKITTVRFRLPIPPEKDEDYVRDEVRRNIQQQLS
jgi:hypothetical protein